MLLLMGDAAGRVVDKAVVLGVLGLVMIATWIILVLGTRILGLIGVTGINVLTRVFGIVLSALAVQYVIDGIRSVVGG